MAIRGAGLLRRSGCDVLLAVPLVLLVLRALLTTLKRMMTRSSVDLNEKKDIKKQQQRAAAAKGRKAE